jgi:ABC-2 type transport system ATP-binding protein
MSDQVAIKTQGLAKAYGKVQALRGVDLEVRRGEIFGFLGPNGAGKTTTIRCLLDLIRPQGGTIRVLGLDPQVDPVAVRARTGYLPGELSLEANSKVEAALRYLNDLRGNKADWAYVRQLAGGLELDLTMPIKNLSKGNKQKVGVVQALMSRPELLLLDEPTSGLDPLMMTVFQDVVRERHASGRTVLLSSHILSEVEALCDHLTIIRKGRASDSGSFAELRHLTRTNVVVETAQPIDFLADQPGVHDVELDGGRAHAEFAVDHDDLNAVLTRLVALDVRALTTSPPTLEELFLRHYKDEIPPEPAPDGDE